MLRPVRIPIAVLLLALAGCGPSQKTAPPHAAQSAAAGALVYSVPADSSIPADAVGAAVRRGRALVLATRDSLPGNVGNRLRCVSCHLDAGTRRSSGPWVGVFTSFPQYNKRAARVVRIEDRVNDCFLRSMAGRPLDAAGRDMNDIVAYLAFLSRGLPQGIKAPWLGLKRLGTRSGDVPAGSKLFVAACARCHGAGGQGGTWPQKDDTLHAPPLWGGGSFAIGAGMARIQTAAAFIRWNMPYDKPGTLNDQEAFDVAAFVLSHPRPDTPGKERDWPKGDAPGDCPYRTLAAKR